MRHAFTNPPAVSGRRPSNPFRPDLARIIADELERGFRSTFMCLRTQAELSAHIVIEMVARHIAIAHDSSLNPTISKAMDDHLSYEYPEGDSDQAYEADELDGGECAPEETQYSMFDGSVDDVLEAWDRNTQHRAFVRGDA